MLSLAALLPAIGSCRDAGPLAPLVEPDAPQHAMGIASTPNSFFTFLQPITPKPVTNGKFNRALAPVVEICRRWDQVSGACQDTVATFSRDRAPSRTPNEVIRVTGQAYAVNWNTGSFEGLAGRTYRVAVRVGRHTLGQVRVAVSDGSPRAGAQDVDHTVVYRSTLLIQFHIGEGALREALVQSGECNDCTETVVSSTEPTTLTTPSKDAGVFFPQGAIPAEVGEVTVTINRIRPTTQPCLPTTVEQAEGCYSFETEPFLQSGFSKEVMVGVCLDRSKSREEFQLHKFSERRAAEGIVALRPAAPTFLSCEDFALSNSKNPLLRLAASRLGQALQPVARLFGPTTLHAGDVGEGGMTGSFSRMGWLKTQTLETVQGDGQIAASGAALPKGLVIRVTSGHGSNTVPAESVAVVFTVSQGAGAVTYGKLPTATVRTNRQGYAAVLWTLGNIGANVVTASLPSGVSVVFKATALEPAPLVNVRAGTTSTTSTTSQVGTPTVGSIAEAVSLVAPGGRVVVYDGTYPTPGVYLDRAFTIEAASGAHPVLDAGGAWASLWMWNIGSGTATLRGLEFRNARNNGINISGRFDRVVVENSRFHPTVSPTQNNGLGYSGGVGAFNATGNELLVQNSTFTGGDIGVHANNAGPVVVRGNTFSGQINAAVHVGHGSNGRIEGNTISQCGPRWCIGLFSAGSYEVVNNTLSLDMDKPSSTPIFVHAQSAVVQGNRVLGSGGTMDVQNPESFPIRFAGISFYRTGSATVTGNTVQRARNGIWFHESSGTGRENLISQVGTGIGAHQLPAAGAVGLQRNSISGYTHPFSSPSTGHLPDFTCNWWGDSGPRGIGWWVNRGLYAPWAPSSSSTSSCTDGFATVDVVVPGTPRTPGQPVADNVADALIWAQTGGTVRVQAGVHPVANVFVKRPVTIEGVSTPRPTVDAGGNNGSLFIQEAATSGMVTIRNLSFRNAKYNNIFVHREHGGVLIEGSEFFPGRDPAPQGQHGYWSGVNVGQATGSGVTVRNSSFQGGDIGVNSWQSARQQLTVRSNTFSGQGTAGINLGQIQAVAEENTFQGCGRFGCINLWETSSSSVLGNTIDVLTAGSTDNPIAIGRSSQINVRRNTINGCGRYNCISGGELSDAEISDNVVNADITTPGDNGIGIGNSNGVTITGNRIMGSGGAHNPADSTTFAIRQNGIAGWENSNLTISGNTVANTRWGIGSWRVDRAVIRDNQVRGCGLGCINIGEPGAGVQIFANDLRPSAAPSGPNHWKSAINVHHARVAGGVVVESNTIVGAAPSNPADWASYSLQDGIHANNWDQGRSVPTGLEVIVSGNTVRNAGAGLSAAWGGNIAGVNNRVDGAFFGVTAYSNGRNAIQRSDITNTHASLNVDDQSTLGVTCNWWGNASGPQNVRSGINSAVYTPWANAPIAGTGRSC